MKLYVIALSASAVMVAGGMAAAQTWALKGDWAESCCCAAACPCVFGSAPTRGHCEGSALLQIEEGHYGDVEIGGLDVVVTYSIDEWARIYVDEKATDEQMDALVKLLGQDETFGMLVAGDVEIRSTERADIDIDKSDSKIAFSVPDATVKLEPMTGPNGEIIRIENLGVPWFTNGYEQYTATTTSFNRGDEAFEYSGTNGAVSHVEVTGPVEGKKAGGRRSMSSNDIHRAASADGTQIAGHVEGHGPPLVFVHGGLGDGQTSWSALVPFLREQFTCYLLSTRGRGQSQDATDHSRERIVQDIVAYVESIGGPVGVVGHSSGAALALDAAAQTTAVSALALYEPTVFDLGTRDPALDENAFARLGAAVADGRPVDAVRVFLEDVALATQEELELMADQGSFEALAKNLPIDLKEAAQSGPPHLSDLGVLDRITMPVLLLYGTHTADFYKGVVSELAARLPDPHVREIPDAAHLGPQLVPEPIAEELTRFFRAAQRARSDAL